MSCPSDVRDFLIGIDYDDIAEDRGHLTLRRKVSLSEILIEITEIMNKGCSFPQFPVRANPTVTYAYDLNDQEDADIYGEIINELDKINKKEKQNGI